MHKLSADADRLFLRLGADAWVHVSESIDQTLGLSRRTRKPTVKAVLR